MNFSLITAAQGNAIHFQVLVITVILTFLFRKDTDMKEFEDSFGQPQNWFDVYSKPGNLTSKIKLTAMLHIYLYFKSKMLHV